MSDSSDDHNPLTVVDPIHDSVVPDPNPMVVASGELDGTGRAGLEREGVDSRSNAGSDRVT